MKFGTILPANGPMCTPEALAKLACHAEKCGFSAVGIADHVVIPTRIYSRYPYTETGKPPNWGEWVEQLTTLTFVAARTKKIRILTSVMVVPYRHPLLAAKALSTIDLLSRGRLTVGVGAGWMREEFQALDAPPFEERGEVTDESIRIMKEAWTNDRPEFHGNHFNIAGIKFLPKPVQKPHPPIWVGGESPPAMRRAAELGDCWYPIGSNPRFPLGTIEQIGSAIERLRGYERKAGRKSRLSVGYVAPAYDLTQRASAVRGGKLFVGDPDKIVADIEECEKLGISYISFELISGNLDRSEKKMSDFSKRIMSKFV
jgi:probable F420-dependent oxidoreductase